VLIARKEGRKGRTDGRWGWKGEDGRTEGWMEGKGGWEGGKWGWKKKDGRVDGRKVGWKDHIII
jgi:hypothetical protein